MPNKTNHLAALLILCSATTVAAPLLDGGVNGTLDGVRDTLDRPLPLPEPHALDLPGQALGEVSETAETLTSALPDRLPILTVNGDAAFVEVTLETSFRAVEREWLVAIDAAQRASLATNGIVILEERDYPALALTTVRIRVPAAWDDPAVLRDRLNLDDSATLDRNHIYSPQVDTQSAAVPAASTTAQPVCDHAIALGMIDTAIHQSHPALAAGTVVARTFRAPDLPAARAHGTAVAALFIGRGPGLSPLAPAASLYAADVFYGRDAYSQGATLNALLGALQWLAEQRVAVINMSLTGPPNALLERAVQALTAQHIPIVAAVGNQGPASPPLYPAGYGEAVAVTAVDQDNAVYRWANRGDHVDFAALGVGVVTARGLDDYGRESGTSLAAPLVSARLACAMATSRAEAALATLAAEAEDLGEAGRDPVYGHGLVGRGEERN